MKATISEHPGYNEIRKVDPDYTNVNQIFGRWHYIYESEKGKISLIKLTNYFHDGKDLWEIYCLDGDLFEDIERFSSKKEAEIRIKELLEENNHD